MFLLHMFRKNYFPCSLPNISNLYSNVIIKYIKDPCPVIFFKVSRAICFLLYVIFCHFIVSFLYIFAFSFMLVRSSVNIDFYEKNWTMQNCGHRLFKKNVKLHHSSVIRWFHSIWSFHTIKMVHQTVTCGLRVIKML